MSVVLFRDKASVNFLLIEQKKGSERMFTRRLCKVLKSVNFVIILLNSVLLIQVQACMVVRYLSRRDKCHVQYVSVFFTDHALQKRIIRLIHFWPSLFKIKNATLISVNIKNNFLRLLRRSLP